MMSYLRKISHLYDTYIEYWIYDAGQPTDG